jgi:hypothetical protein
MTNRELLMMLDGDLGERAIKNCIEIGRGELYLNETSIYNEVSNVLFDSFQWHASPQGFYFWKKIFKELQSIDL